MSRIWFDITTSRDWTRPPVGVVRVEQSIARALKTTHGNDVTFCAYDAAKNAVNEVPATLAEEWMSSKNETKPAAEPANVVMPGLEKRIGSYGKRAFAFSQTRLSEPARERLEFELRRVKRRLDATIGVARHLRNELRRLGSDTPVLPEIVLPTLASPSAVPFGQGDVYISTGLDWANKNLPALYAAKREVGFKVIWFCHDVIPMIHPHFCAGDVASWYSRYFCDVAWLADVVMCNSECSRRDFESAVAKLHAPVPKTEVVRLGGDITTSPTAKAPSDPRVQALLDERFILFVSSIDRRKNHDVLRRAYTRFHERGVRVPKLVIVGMRGWGVEDLLRDFDRDPRLRENLVELDRVSDADLEVLYAHCLFTVYPSLYEGWGLPVVESLVRGKLCVASTTPAVKEAAGDWVEYVDPLDAMGWMNTIERLSNDAAELRQKTERIRREYVPFGWRDTAEAFFTTANALRGKP